MRSTASGFSEPPHLRDHASDIAQAYIVPKARSDSVSPLVLLPPPCRRRFARTLLPLCLCEGRCPFLHLGQATLLADPGQIFADDCSRWCLFSRHPSPWYQRL